MSLQKCAHCGSELADPAAGCPSCGGGPSGPRSEALAQQRAKAIKRFWLVSGGLLAVLVAALVWAAQNGHGPVEPRALSAQEIEALRVRAQEGDAEAQSALGAAYAQGNGVKLDYSEAAKWYQQAARKGNAAALVALGELHEAGQGVSRDDAEAANCYRRAAEQGLATAQYDLAALYAVGKGVKLDNAEALKWYLAAANQGETLAQYNVGMRYLEGHGVAAHPTLAFKWLSLAAKQGLPDAAAARDALKSRMTTEQLARARQLIQEFRPQVTGAQSARMQDGR